MIDDDVELCKLLEDYFVSEGFRFSCAHSGDEGLNLLASRQCDIAILDVMLPGRDGFEILKEIRNISSVPVIMLTAKGDHVDRVIGLEMGADDYICKPFSMRELSARVRAVLRRSGGLLETASLDVICLIDLEMDLKSRSVKIGNKPVPLTNVEFRLLESLLSCAGRGISPEQLSWEALGRGHTPFDRSLSVHISRLRRKLGLYPCGSERIKTLRGEGFIYVFPERDAPESNI
ncbi:MAG: response regulator transcription factor [Synergistaceae bacterium]|nr:response regulator transcription factor [Synergistaceae bacterium]